MQCIAQNQVFNIPGPLNFLIMKKLKHPFLVFSIVVVILVLLLLVQLTGGSESGGLFGAIPALLIAGTVAAAGFICCRALPGNWIYIQGEEPARRSKNIPGTLSSGLFMALALYLIHDILKVQPAVNGEVTEAARIASDSILYGMVFNFIILTAILYPVNRFFVPGRYRNLVFWSLAAVLSMAEPALQVYALIISGSIDSLFQLFFIAQFYFILNIISFLFLRYRGFAGMIIFRVTEASAFALFALASW